MHLNTEQRAAIEHRGHCAIVAGPGSAKTRVLVETAAHILTSELAATVLIVTFTRDAAREPSPDNRGSALGAILGEAQQCVQRRATGTAPHHGRLLLHDALEPDSIASPVLRALTAAEQGGHFDTLTLEERRHLVGAQSVRSPMPCSARIASAFASDIHTTASKYASCSQSSECADAGRHRLTAERCCPTREPHPQSPRARLITRRTS